MSAKKTRCQYLYKFLNEQDEVIYVGKTSNINKRMCCHFSDKGYDWVTEVDKIFYHKFEKYTDCDIYEIYYINLLVPKYNKDSNNGDVGDVKLDEITEWKPCKFRKAIRSHLYNANLSTTDIDKLYRLYDYARYEKGNIIIETKEDVEFISEFLNLCEKRTKLFISRTIKAGYIIKDGETLNMNIKKWRM